VVGGVLLAASGEGVVVCGGWVERPVLAALAAAAANCAEGEAVGAGEGARADSDGDAVRCGRLVALFLVLGE
jgi:hypothetical protein